MHITTETLIDMRNWLADARVVSKATAKVLCDDTVIIAIEREYDGGVSSFLTENTPIAIR